MVKVIIPILLLVLLIACASVGGDRQKKHHAANGFRNPYGHDEHSFSDFLKWRRERKEKKIPGVEDYNFPIADNDPVFLRGNRGKNTLTWIGHATVLLQLDGKNILTDPHFSKRASPVQWAGPERVVAPGIASDDLPEIDVVLISHDHYDSLDSGSIKKLSRRRGGDKTHFIVPLGMEEWLRNRGAKNVTELDWWEKIEINGMLVIAVPAQHWSKRTFFGRNKTLWAGWIVISNTVKFYFAGDTGYSPLFKEIGEKYGPFDLAAIPIGAYEPRWFMKDHHVNPEEAVRIHQDVRARKSVAVHWGTFILTDEPLDEPPRLLEKALKYNGLDKNDFVILKHGETMFLK